MLTVYTKYVFISWVKQISFFMLSAKGRDLAKQAAEGLSFTALTTSQLTLIFQKHNEPHTPTTTIQN